MLWLSSFFTYPWSQKFASSQEKKQSLTITLLWHYSERQTLKADVTARCSGWLLTSKVLTDILPNGRDDKFFQIWDGQQFAYRASEIICSSFWAVRYITRAIAQPMYSHELISVYWIKIGTVRLGYQQNMSILTIKATQAHANSWLQRYPELSCSSSSSPPWRTWDRRRSGARWSRPISCRTDLSIGGQKKVEIRGYETVLPPYIKHVFWIHFTCPPYNHWQGFARLDGPYEQAKSALQSF